MAVPHQKRIVVGIWVVTLADAVRQGIFLPTDFSQALPRFTFNWAMIFFGLLAPPLLIVAQGLFRKVFPKLGGARVGLLTRWVDHRWGQMSTHQFLHNLRPMALMCLGCLVLGAVGLMSCIYFGASPFGFAIASFFLSAGAGFGAARVLAIRFFPEQSWV